MSEHKSMICIGGPFDGRRMAILHGNGFCVPVQKEMPVATDAMDYRPNATAIIENVYYRAEVFNTPQGHVSFWVPKDQTPLETITRLLAVYELATTPSHKDGR